MLLFKYKGKETSNPQKKKHSVQFKLEKSVCAQDLDEFRVNISIDILQAFCEFVTLCFEKKNHIISSVGSKHM